MRTRAIVLGAAEGTGNIGEEVVKGLRDLGWKADGDACQRVGGVPKYGQNIYYDAPPVEQFERGNYDACVITLGTTYKDHFADVSEDNLKRVLRGCLELPLIAARRYVEASQRVDEEDGDEARDVKFDPRYIVFIGSYAHDHPFTNGTAYCAAKAGLDMAARTLGWELTDRGFRIFIVHPWHVKGTPMWAEVEKGVMESKGWTKEQADAYADRDLKMPLNLHASEVADVVCALLNDPALGWLSGSAVELRGGTR